MRHLALQPYAYKYESMSMGVWQSAKPYGPWSKAWHCHWFANWKYIAGYGIRAMSSLRFRVAHMKPYIESMSYIVYILAGPYWQKVVGGACCPKSFII